MKNCPLCGWSLEPVWDQGFKAWHILCLDWTVYAIDKDIAIRNWEKLYGEWMNNDVEL